MAPGKVTEPPPQTGPHGCNLGGAVRCRHQLQQIAPCAKIETQRRAVAREIVQNRRLAHKIVRLAVGEELGSNLLPRS